MADYRGRYSRYVFVTVELFVFQAKTEAAIGSTRGVLDLTPVLSPALLPKDSAKVGPEVAACQVGELGQCAILVWLFTVSCVISLDTTVTTL